MIALSAFSIRFDAVCTISEYLAFQLRKTSYKMQSDINDHIAAAVFNIVIFIRGEEYKLIWS